MTTAQHNMLYNMHHYKLHNLYLNFLVTRQLIVSAYVRLHLSEFLGSFAHS